MSAKKQKMSHGFEDLMDEYMDETPGYSHADLKSLERVLDTPSVIRKVAAERIRKMLKKKTNKFSKRAQRKSRKSRKSRKQRKSRKSRKIRRVRHR